MKILEAIVNLIPFSTLLESWGVEEGLSGKLGAVLNISLVVVIYKLLTSGYEWIRVRNTEKKLGIVFPYRMIKDARRNFIESRFQNHTPTHEEEPGFSTRYVSTNSLIKFFLRTAFNERKERAKFYLVLAGSGMGKTTFMINLYMRSHSTWNFRRRYKLRLLAFRDDEMMKKISGIKPEEAANTILLLDAFDEDRHLLPPENDAGLTDDERFRKRLDEVVDAVQGFREVVITSRTQYFPGQENKPYELKVGRLDGKGYHTLAKLYLSPFSRKEIQRYLRTKYPFFRVKRRRKAMRIVEQSPKLMVRPMLLSYIDYLVDSGKNFHSIYESYNTLIEKWIDREAIKQKPISERESFKAELGRFSDEVAKSIYYLRQVDSSLSLSRDDALEISQQAGLNLMGYEITGKSLLTRDANQNWKFAHKSIFEFYVAKHWMAPTGFLPEVKTMIGLDMARKFLESQGWPVDMVRVEGGRLEVPAGSESELGNVLEVQEFYISRYLVTQEVWRTIMGFDPKSLQFKHCDRCPVESVSWNDCLEFLERLNEKTGMEFRLLSKVEWEYAARGGMKSNGFEFAGSNELDRVGWYSMNSDEKTHPVGQMDPNELGLYDVSGNVWEWCQDAEDIYRVLCGGSWGFAARYCRVTYRNFMRPDGRNGSVGFRLAHSL